MEPRSSTRDTLELRQTHIKWGELPNHDGSALFSFGSTSTLASIDGPGEVRMRDELTDRAALDINLTFLQGVPGISAQSFQASLSSLLSSVLLLHLYPRSLIQVNLQTYTLPPIYGNRNNRRLGVQKMEAQRIGGKLAARPHPDMSLTASERASHINATMCALLDSGIPVRATFASCPAAYVPSGTRRRLERRGWRPGEGTANGEEGKKKEKETSHPKSDSYELILDPTPLEESEASSTFVLAFAFSGDIPLDASSDSNGNVLFDAEQAVVVLSECSGRYTWKEFQYAVKICREASKRIRDQMRESLQPPVR